MEESFPLMVVGVLEIVFGGIWLGSLIYKPPTNQPPRVFIGRVLMPICPILFGASMVMQPATALTGIPVLIAFVLTFVALYLQLRYRPARA